MSDAHLTERPVDGGNGPVELTDEPIRLSRRDPALEPERKPTSRRRKIVLAAALAVGVAGAGALGLAGWGVLKEKDAQLTQPDAVAGLTRDDSERARSTAEYLRDGFAADIELDHSIGTVYADPADAKRSVLLFGGTTLLWQPERDLDTLFDLMADETGKVAGVREVDAGRLGGVMKCGTTTGDGGDFAVCGWADHGSVAMGMLPGRPLTEAATLFREIREGVQRRS
ncbi:hypothetical protein O7602_05205 [Micromonospora sp. WMMD1128]|uniref:hypothetical protein n=1 Tax=unclassified Micromonospora TaxID=2617518 RepID=UPI00248B40D5|nr:MULTISPECIES: hypothetical protein [unclassified Micromonospora]WBB74934.1 hypothetical protein O7602_05205 [Micromonospora sp. WMMD1128]WFE31690.1 hypothetical protein O7613_18985 [Micromonospora sp. WMMD975]